MSVPDLIPGMTAQVRQLIFGMCPQYDCAWLGDVYEISPGREVIPFKLNDQLFLAFFLSPMAEAGGDEDFVASMANLIADGFVPDVDSRLIKFCRADALVSPFHPDGWRLSHARDIYRFCEMLARVLVAHLSADIEVRQYFYSPATESLERLYQRIFERTLWGEPLREFFAPINTEIGVFHGYERKA